MYSNEIVFFGLSDSMTTSKVKAFSKRVVGLAIFNNSYMSLYLKHLATFWRSHGSKILSAGISGICGPLAFVYLGLLFDLFSGLFGTGVFLGGSWAYGWIGYYSFICKTTLIQSQRWAAHSDCERKVDGDHLMLFVYCLTIVICHLVSYCSSNFWMFVNRFSSTALITASLSSWFFSLFTRIRMAWTTLRIDRLLY